MTDQIRTLANDIASHFDVERIILFGSRARGTAAADSDVDLLVIMRYQGRETDQAVKILTRVNPRFAVDLLVRTPVDTARRYRQYDPLVRDALDNGVVLYAKRGAGVGGKGRRRLPVRAKAAAGTKRS
jgi:predicted nucleotidyltransferase